MLKGKTRNQKDQQEQCPAGNHPGVCVAVIDLGTHWERFQGGAAKKTRKVLLCWEVDVGQSQAAETVVIGRDYNIAYSKEGDLVYGDKSHLRQLLESWRGKPYGPEEEVDLEIVLGKPGQVNVIHEPSGDRTFARVKTVTPLSKGQSALKPTRKPALFLADGKEPLALPDWLPEVYGESTKAIVTRCLEQHGTGERPAPVRPAARLTKEQLDAPADIPGDDGTDEVPF